jgi:hypothetical protein
MRFLTPFVCLAVMTDGAASGQADYVPPVRIRTPADFPPPFRDLAGPLGALDTLEIAARNTPEGDVRARFNTGPVATLHRWRWLTAWRRNIEYYDDLTRKAKAHEREYRRIMAAIDHRDKEAQAKRYDLEFQVFVDRRVVLRSEWYYAAKGHHFRWEKDRLGGPLLAQTERGLCKFLGCTRDQFEMFLAWTDVLATDFLPRHMSLWLTIPLSLLS